MRADLAMILLPFAVLAVGLIVALIAYVGSLRTPVEVVSAASSASELRQNLPIVERSIEGVVKERGTKNPAKKPAHRAVRA